MSIFTKLYGLCCLVFFFTLSSNAQSSSNGATFTCVALTGLPMETLYFKSGKEVLPIQLGRKSRRGAAIPLTSNSGELTFYTREEDANGELIYLKAAQASYPENASQLLCLLMKAPKKASLPLKMIILEDSLDSFPVGSYRVMNFSKEEIGVIVGAGKNRVGPGQHKTIQPDIPKEGGFVPFAIINKKSEILKQTQLFGQPRSRKMILITPPTKPNQKVTVSFIPQTVPLPSE